MPSLRVMAVMSTLRPLDIRNLLNKGRQLLLLLLLLFVYLLCFIVLSGFPPPNHAYACSWNVRSLL